MPTGPVTHSKAWIEMVHRYLASGVGVLIIALTVAAWLGRNSVPRPAMSPWWPSVTLLWVCLQGAFGALTVTMKLFPAIVTLHLLGGYGLLALLTVQAVLLSRANALPGSTPQGDVAIPRALRVWIVVALLMLLVQAASGAWVSTNYAVLACTDFPQCHGSWWPAMNFATGFDIWRPLGLHEDGTLVSLQSLTAIHYTHRMLALLTVVMLGLLAWRLLVQAGRSDLRTPALWLIGLLALQVSTGISNVVLGWPLLAALLHTGGAGALTVVLVWLLATIHFKRTVP